MILYYRSIFTHDRTAMLGAPIYRTLHRLFVIDLKNLFRGANLWLIDLMRSMAGLLQNFNCTVSGSIRISEATDLHLISIDALNFCFFDITIIL